MQTLNTFVTTEKGPDLISNTSFIKAKEWTYLIYDLSLLRSEPMRQETLSKWRNLHRNREQLAKLSMCRWIFWRKLWKKYIRAYRLWTMCEQFKRYGIFFLPFISFVNQNRPYDLLQIVPCKLWTGWRCIFRIEY